MSYKVQLIDIIEKDRLLQKYQERFLYTSKADVYGCCVKLLTDVENVKNLWEDNFFSMSENTRSHGRLIVLEEAYKPMTVQYEPYTKTTFLVNMDYYGWIKSIALALAGDVLEDEHGIYSVHGAAIDVDTTGVSIIAPSGTGKTTHSWGLLRMEETRLVADDWYFVRLSSREPLAFGSEKNCYINADIGKIWNEYERLVDKARFDKKGRAVVNVRWIVGSGGVIPLVTMKNVILLKRDADDETIVQELSVEKALDYMIKNDFCNPHQLIRDERKMKLRADFFRRFFEKTKVYLVNTTGTPQETQTEIRELLAV